MSSNGNSFANFENLNANNWTLWSNNMKNYLRIQNCWFAIEKEKSEYAVRPRPTNIPPVLAADGTTTSPGSTLQPTDKQLKDYDDKLKDWEEANQKAIERYCEDFWETLKTQYGKVGTAALVTKLLDLFRMTFKPGQNPAITIDSFQNKYIEITSLNDKIAIPEFVLCTLLMHKLGRGWDNFISNIMTNEYTPDKTTGVDEHWTLDHIRNLLSEEYNSRLSRASHNNTYANVARFSGIQTGGTTQSFSSQRAKNTRRGAKRSNSAPTPSGNSNQNKNTSPTSAASSSNSNQNTGNFRGNWRARGNFRGRSRGNYRGRGRGRGNNIVTNMAIMDELEEDTDDADNEESSEEEGEQSSNSILQQSTMMILPDDPRRHYQAPPLFVPPLFRVPPSVASDIIPPSELTMPPAHRDSGTFIPPSTQAESSGSSEIIFRPIPPPRIRSSPDTEIGEINQDLPSLTHAPSTSSEEPPASQHTGALTTNQVPSEIGIGEEIWERPVSPSFHPTSNDQIPLIWDNVNVLPQFLSSRLRFHYCSFGHIVRYGAPSTCHQGHEIVLITNRYHTKEERPVIHIYYSNLRSVPPAHYEQVLSSRRWYGVRTFGEARFLYNTTRAEWDADRNYEYSRAITDFTNVMPRSSEHPDASLRMQINRVMRSIMQITDRLTDYEYDHENPEAAEQLHLRATPDYDTNSDFGLYEETTDDDRSIHALMRNRRRRAPHRISRRTYSRSEIETRLPDYQNSISDTVVSTSFRMRSAFTSAPVFFTEEFSVQQPEACPFPVVNTTFNLEDVDPMLFHRPDFIWVQSSYRRLTLPNHHAIYMAIRANLVDGDTFSNEAILEQLRSSNINDTFNIPHGRPPYTITFLLTLLQHPNVPIFIIEDRSVILSAVLPISERSMIDHTCLLRAGLGDPIAQEIITSNAQEYMEIVLLDGETAPPHYAMQRIKEVHDRIRKEGDSDERLVLPENIIHLLRYLQLDAYSQHGLYNQIFEDKVLVIMHDYDPKAHELLRELTAIGRRETIELWVERRMMDFREKRYDDLNGSQDSPINVDADIDIWNERDLARHNPILDVLVLRTNLPVEATTWLTRREHAPRIEAEIMLEEDSEAESEVEFVEGPSRPRPEPITVDSDSDKSQMDTDPGSADGGEHYLLGDTSAPFGTSPGGSPYHGAFNIVSNRRRSVYEAVRQLAETVEGEQNEVYQTR
ncbi:hypothetical protein K435DRAFT_876051 [Dendrothele bispora CBS 962.96]|uniref:Uncharacterized protein n=1 Tax=Dendrothele bispora (strain CBS 962.96) TaxID=1314807 RepID=A0A4S8KTE2_DENBC|nr:hypothetical protein K435DRAFT_876051 [Dendrothele bispora CBS 962.96]